MEREFILMEKEKRIWELLAKRLSGEIQPSEVEELETLTRAGGQEGTEYMINVMKNYSDSIQNAPEHDSIRQTTRQRKEKALVRIEEEYAAMAFKEKKNFNWWYVAASVILLAGLFLFFSGPDSIQSSLNVVTTQNGSKSLVMLPDSTEVWLNAGSCLSYSSNFKDADVREVTLSGEAYFKVKHDVCHPFIIHTQYLNIKDLGTAFNVRAYPDENKCETTLIEGSITVSLKEDPGKNLHLKPGEKIMYFVDKHKLVKNQEVEEDIKKTAIQPITPTHKLEVSRVSPVVIHPGDTVISEIAWLDNQLVFNNESFSELANRMNRFFDAKIEIKSRDVENYSFTGVFEGETLEQALNELQMIRPFRYTVNKNKVIIRTK